MSDTANGNERRRNPQRPARPEQLDIGELTARLQSQVNDLLERVTGVREIKRQYLTLGLTVGVLVGLVLGVLIGMLMHAVTEDGSTS